MEKYNKFLRNITELIERGLYSSNDIKKEGNTEVNIEIENDKNLFVFKLNKKRHIDQKSYNLIKKKGVFCNIS